MSETSEDPGELVTRFCAQWGTGDYEALLDYFAEDAVYHNIPMEPLSGIAEIKAFLETFAAMASSIDFVIHRQVVSGNVVMNERTDTLRMLDGNTVNLPVMGSFEVEDQKIVAWRDYFDMGQFAGG
jgi:limonene-1,2-epoxide hydrolase